MAETPRYERIRADLESQVRSGILRPGAQIPSESALAEQYGVTRMTVRQALEQLSSDGVLVERRGLGTFVAEPRATYRKLNRLSSFRDEVGVEGHKVDTEVKAREVVSPRRMSGASSGSSPARRRSGCCACA
jgi:GntR family transcriptional regulator